YRRRCIRRVSIRNLVALNSWSGVELPVTSRVNPLVVDASRMPSVSRNSRQHGPLANIVAAVLPLCLSCGGAEPVARPPNASSPAPALSEQVSSSASESPRQLEADARLNTASGATFEAAKGWFVTSRKDSLQLDGPERDLTIVLIEIRESNAL